MLIRLLVKSNPEIVTGACPFFVFDFFCEGGTGDGNAGIDRATPVVRKCT